MSTCRVSFDKKKSITESNRYRTISGSNNDGDLLDWYPSQVKGPVDDEVQEGTMMFDERIFANDKNENFFF